MPFWNHQTFLFAAIASLSIAASGGCGQNDGRCPIHGEVTLDGEPASGAVISFRAIAGSEGNSSGATVDEQGRFSIPADKGLIPGDYAVNIQCWKDTGQKVQDPCSQQYAPVVAPVEYAETGKLQITVTADGDRQFNFPLTTKGK